MMSNTWRPYAGYIHVPGIWLDEKPVDFRQVTLPRALDVMCHQKVRGGFEATITREGLVFFRFAGTPLDPGPIDTSIMIPGQHELFTRVNHERAEILTFHSACLAMARGEATNSVGYSAANVTPAVMIHGDEDMQNLGCLDRE